jgi:tetratricopeptide (TPR) repeat protein
MTENGQLALLETMFQLETGTDWQFEQRKLFSLELLKKILTGGKRMFWKKKNKTPEKASTPAEDIQTARAALKQGDTRHATQHLAWALAVEPENLEARTLLDELIRNSPNPLDLVQWDKPPIPYPMVAVQAYIRVKQGELDTPLALLAQIYQVVPGLPFLAWLVEWLENNPKLDQLQTGTVGSLLNNLHSKIKDLNNQDVNLLKRTLPTFSAYHQIQTGDIMLTLLLSIFHRKLGKLDEALVLALSAHRNAPSYFTATVLGGAYKDRHEIEQAVATFREALIFKPQDIPIRLDIGDTLCDNGQIEAGLAVYREVLALEPNHAWAYPSYLYYQSLLEPTGDWQKQLEKFAKANPQNERANYLLNQLSPYLSELPEPSDATINLARQLMEETDFPTSLEVSLSSLEAPSAYRTLQLIQLELYGKADIKWNIGEIQKPDPRHPRGKVEFALWRYNGVVPEVNLPPPEAIVSGLVAELATTSYEANQWWAKAEKTAKLVSINQINDLLAVMLYPPPRPKGIEMWNWLQQVQVAVAFIIARLESGWEGSVRRRVLFSLARGPMDWSVTAAIVALCQIVRKEGTGKAEVESLYLELLQNLPRPGGVPYEYALIFCSFYLEPSAELAKVTGKMLDKLTG